MKKVAIFISLAISAFNVNAQGVATLNENFDTNCPSGGTHPTGWVTANPILSTIPDGMWKCSGNGRYGTSGIECTNYWAGNFHLDTSYLTSPMLNFTGYVDADSVYVRFDARTNKIHKGGKLSVLAATDSGSIPQSDIELVPDVLKIIGPDDSANWVTHSINMTAFKSFGDFHLSFRYTGTDTSGSTWFLDNVYTTKAPLVVPTVPSTKFTLSATGSTSSGSLTINYQVMNQEPFMLSVYDLMGRVLHSKNFTPIDRSGTYVANGLNLTPGLYLVRMSNGNASRVARAYVE